MSMIKQEHSHPHGHDRPTRNMTMEECERADEQSTDELDQTGDGESRACKIFSDRHDSETPL